MEESDHQNHWYTMIATSRVWKRLQQNKAAIGGLIIILLCALLAIVGYLIAPDGTPNANRMTVEIGGQLPGYQQLFLKVPTLGQLQSSVNNFIEGYEDRFAFIPIHSYACRFLPTR